MATLQDDVNALKANPNEAAGYNQVVSAGMEAKKTPGGDPVAAMQDAYDKLYPKATLGTPASTASSANAGANAGAVSGSLPDKVIAPQESTNPYAVTSSEEQEAQARQNAFDAANKVGTKEEDINRNITPEAINAEKAKLPIQAPVGGTPANQQNVNGKVGVEKGRATEIVTNLNEGYRNDEAIKKALDNGDFEAFKSHYNMQDPEEAKIVQAFFQARQPKDKNGYLSILMQGQDIWNPEVKNTPEFKAAEAIYAKLKQFQGANASQIESAVGSGDLVPGTKEYDAVKGMNPAGIAAYEKLKQNTTTTNSINDYATGLYNASSNIGKYDKNKTVESQSSEPNKTPDILTQLSNMMTKNTTPDLVKQWNEKIANNPEIVNLTKDVNSIKGELDKLSIDEANMEDTVKAELIGTDAGQDYVDAKVRARLKDIYKQKSKLGIDMQTKQNTLTSLTQNAKDLMDLEYKQYQMQSDVDKEMRGYAFDIFKTQQSQDFAKEQQNREFDLKYGDINSEDPRIRQAAAQKAVDEIRETYKGMPFVRSSGAMANDITALLDANPGMTLSQAIDQNIVSAIQAAPQYQQWKEKTGLEENADEAKMKDIQIQTAAEQLRQLKGGKITAPEWRQDTSGNWYDINSKVRPDLQAAGNTLNSPMANTPDGTVFKENERGYWCGQFVNDSLGSRIFGDLIGQKESKINSQTPVVGGAVIMDMPGKFSKNGHVGLVVGTTANGILMKSSNFSGAGKVSTVEIPFTDPRIKGYYTPTKSTSTATGGNVTLTTSDISKFNDSTFKETSLKTPEDKAKYQMYLDETNSIYSNPNADFFKVLEYSQGGKGGTVSERKQIGQYQQALSGLENISSQINDTTTGPIIGRLKKLNPYSTDVATFKATIQGLVPTVARGVFNEVGVLTDNDVKQYLQTLPRLENTKEQNKMITNILLKTLGTGIKAQLDGMARSGLDVSKFTGLVKRLDSQIESTKVTASGTKPAEKGKIISTDKKAGTFTYKSGVGNYTYTAPNGSSETLDSDIDGFIKKYKKRGNQWIKDELAKSKIKLNFN